MIYQLKRKTKQYSKGHKFIYLGYVYRLSKNQINRRNKLVEKVRHLNGTI